MDYNKTLIIIANSYPYGNDESFLEGEIKHLSKLFGKIYVVLPNKSKEIFETKPRFEVPANVYILPLNNKYTLLNKLIATLYAFSEGFRKAIKVARERDGLKFSWALAKIILAYLAKDLGFRFLLLKELKVRNLDFSKMAIYSYWMNEYTYSLIRIKKKHPEIKVFSRAHGWDVYYERHDIPYLPFREVILPALDGVFPVSQNATRYLLKKSLNENSKIETCYLGVGKSELNQFDFTPGKITILSLAFLSPVKNIEDLVRTLDLIPDDIEITWYHIGGGGKYAESIYSLAQDKLGNKRNISYTFLGTKDRYEIDEFIASHSIDLLINTSHFEGIPVSMMEALSFGIPVVGPDVGGVSELIDNGKNGFLLQGRSNPEELKNILINYSGLSLEEILNLRKSSISTWNKKFNEDINYKEFSQKLYNTIPDNYLECSRCILNSNDYPNIRLDQNGVCDICYTYDIHSQKSILKGVEGENMLHKEVGRIRTKMRSGKYDCVIGVSGGADSTYLAYMAHLWGLRPLLVHVDTGWNSSKAILNISKLIDKVQFDLYTYVVDWDRMRDAQLSFFKASVVDMDLPADNVIVAALYEAAIKHKVKFILLGHNMVTESWLPPNFNHNKIDVPNLHDIQKKFGVNKKYKLPSIGYIDTFIYSKYYGIENISPLNWLPYDQAKVKEVISEELGWIDYGAKHAENLFTRFYQEYILPQKFKVYKRKAHLSTLVCSGQITREQALLEWKNHNDLGFDLEEDKVYFSKKLNISVHEFDSIMKREPLPHSYYSSTINWYNSFQPFIAWFKFAFKK